MKKLIFNGIIFLLLLFIIDKPIGWQISELAQQRQYDDRIGELALGKINAEVLILGSSRALNDLDAGRFQELSQLSTYNLAFSGSNHEFHLSVLRLTLESFTPKLVILTIDKGTSFKLNPKSIYRKDLLFPFSNHPVVFREIATHTEKIYWLGQLFWMYRENNNLINAMMCLKSGKLLPDITSDIDPYGSVMLKGRSPDFQAFSPETNDALYDMAQESVGLISSVNTMIELCAENGITLWLVIPPMNNNKYGGFTQRLQEVVGKKARIIDMSALPLPEACYFDAGHLNAKGAAIFTEELYKRIGDGI